MRERLWRDAALILAAGLVLGTAANLLSPHRLAWWGEGQLPPEAGTDFNWLDPSSAEVLRASLPEVVFVDTREAAERAAGTVPGAIHLAYTDLARTMNAELLRRLARADALVLYGGTDSADVEQLLAQELRRYGLPPPYVMAGGFAAWELSGLPVEAEEGS